MKRISAFFLIYFLLLLGNTFAQVNCEGAQPICSNQTMTYPLGYDLDAPNTNIDFSCLPDSLNPHWFTFVTTGSGGFNFNVSSNFGGAFAMMVFGPSPIVQSPCPNYTTPIYCTPNGVTQTFSETMAAPNQIYHVLILNNSDTTNQVDFYLTGSAVVNNCPPQITNCNAVTAQYNYTINGNSNFTNKMCFLDTLSISYQNTGQYPQELTNLSAFMPHNPGTAFFVYWKEPDDILPPLLDPGIATFIPWSTNDFEAINLDSIQATLALFPYLNNTIYLKAFPAYNTDSAYVAHYCYDYSSPVIELQMLPDILIDTLSIDCNNNQAVVQFEGSSPQLNAGSSFYPSFTNNVPPMLFLSPSTFGNNDNVTISYLPDTLNPVTFTISDNVGCKKEFTGMFGAPLPNFSYSDTVFCENEPILSPQVNVPSIADLQFVATSSNGSTINIDALNGDLDLTGHGVGSITINMNASYLGCGRDSTLTINILGAPEVDQVNDMVLCPGEDILVQFTSQGNLNLDYFWETMAGVPSFPPSGNSNPLINDGVQNNSLDSMSIQFNYWAIDGSCYSDTLDFLISILPGIDAGQDTAVCSGQEIQLPVAGGTDFVWNSHPDLSSDSNVSTYEANGPDVTLVVEGTTFDNCVVTDTLVVDLLDVDLCSELPYTAFSPNDDGVNDIWMIPGIENYPENKVFIFNRWGDQVAAYDFYNNSNVVWEGKNSQDGDLPAGTYFYLIQYNKDEISKGWVELIK